MKNIRKKPTGVYEFRRQYDGKSYYFSSKIKSEVIDFKRKFEKKIKSSASENLKRQDVKFNDYSRTYFELYKKIELNQELRKSGKELSNTSMTISKNSFQKSKLRIFKFF